MNHPASNCGVCGNRFQPDDVVVTASRVHSAAPGPGVVFDVPSFHVHLHCPTTDVDPNTTVREMLEHASRENLCDKGMSWPESHDEIADWILAMNLRIEVKK